MSIKKTCRRFARLVGSAVWIPVLAASAAANPQTNQPPNAPIITQPAADGLILNPADVHMETGPFSDPDPGDQHLASDWEIWTISPPERVWHEDGATGVEKIHTHLGDGVFENSHLGRSDLMEHTNFFMQVRHEDDSGDPATEWSPWSQQRTFTTGSASQIYTLDVQDVVPAPVPRWIIASDGANVILPPAATPPQLLLESGHSALLLSIQANDGVTNTITDPPALPFHVAVRLQIQGGSQGLSLPASDLLVVDDHCGTIDVLLPAFTIGAGATNFYWISSSGATYVSGSQSTPDFSTLARGLDLPWSPRRPGFHVEVVAGGLQLPVNIAFVPNPGPNPGDPFLYVTELYGKIKVVTRDRTVSDYATGLLNFNPSGSFPGSGEQGLAGLAVDPATGDLFADMLYAPIANPNNHFPKIVRFTSTDGGLTAATQTTILDMVNETQGQSHQISNLTITPDGKLLCHMGDGFNPATSQNLDSFRGKILRMNLDGTPATDNPFYDASDGINSRDYVWAYGVRNPFGGDWRLADGMQYVVENGPSVDRFSQIVPGRNYLYDGSDASMSNFALYNWVPAHGPVNLAFVQSGTFGGSGFPASQMGHAFVSESGPTYASGEQTLGKRITEWILDASGNLVAGPIPFIEYAGSGKATAVGLEAGPDGLYMTELYYDLGSVATQSGARILRIYYDPADDCNDDSIDDVCDIMNGTSADANANWIPDECESSVVPFCFGDGSGVACPCGNTGSTGRGCANSLVGSLGALLSSSGRALVSADTLVMQSSGERPSALSIFWQGDAETAGYVFGDGVGCLGGHLKRLYSHHAIGGTVFGPQGSDLTISARSAALGDPITPGTTRVYHVFYRDPDPGFCPAPLGSTFNTSNGLRVIWGG